MDLSKFEAGASTSAPSAPASPSSGYPTDGNPTTGTPATIPGAYWFYQIQEELQAILATAGLTADEATLSQIQSALDKLYLGPSRSAFSAYQSAAQTLSTNVITKVNLQTAEFDSLGEFSTANSRFTATDAGIYLFTGSVGLNNTTGSYYACYLYKNGGAVATGDNTPAGALKSEIIISQILKLSAGDYVELYAQSTNTTVSLLTGPSYTSLTGARIA